MPFWKRARSERRDTARPGLYVGTPPDELLIKPWLIGLAGFSNVGKDVAQEHLERTHCYDTILRMKDPFEAALRKMYEFSTGTTLVDLTIANDGSIRNLQDQLDRAFIA